MKKEAGGEEKSAGFVLSERSVVPEPVEERFARHNDLKVVSIVCGNEGGISPMELELLVKKGLFSPIHFSVNILRCETAALYGIAAVQTGILGV